MLTVLCDENTNYIFIHITTMIYSARAFRANGVPYFSVVYKQLEKMVSTVLHDSYIVPS
jgi:hypothetical protein